jgi:hypothetical protein
MLITLSIHGCSTTNPSSITYKPVCIIGNCTNGTGQLNNLYKNKLFESKEGVFLNGKLHGKGKISYYKTDRSIDRVYEGTYKKGIPHGNMTYITYANKQIATLSTSIYIDGKEEGAFLYKSYTQGTLTYEQRGRYKKGKKDGKEINIFYDSNGIGSDQIIRHYINGNSLDEDQ